jgi:hypothetical protein
MSDPRRGLPAIHRLVDAALVARYGQARVTEAARAALAEARAAGVVPSLEDAQDRVRRRLRVGVTPVINATGVLLHTNLGRAPWAPRAIAAASAAAGTRGGGARPGDRWPRWAGSRHSGPPAGPGGGRRCAGGQQLRGCGDAGAHDAGPWPGRPGEPRRAGGDRRGLSGASGHHRLGGPPARGGHDQPHLDQGLPRGASIPRWPPS